MQMLLASLVTSLDVKDAAFKSAMASARTEVNRTGQDFEKSGDRMAGAMDRAANAIDRSFAKIVSTADRVGKAVRNAGLALTAGITLPATGLAAASNAAATDFETAMGRVHSALVNASPDELEKLRAAALKLGPAVGKSAIEAAAGIEDLAKNGLSVADILSGGLQSALTLSVVGQTELGTAADATTDILSQFGKSAGELPVIVDKVSGALDVSKLSFDDYKLAIGQVGGVAGGLGIPFDDMNTALAATASYFDGGSDAGTSFKTFLLALNPTSEDAARTMKMLGLEFFDANGQAKSLAQVAEQLRTRLAGLNDRSLRQALTNMFGSDGMRTAIALMKEGAQGIADTRAQIEKVTAGQKTAILLDGEAAAAQRLSGAWENLKIQIGEAGILQALTMVKNGIADVLEVVGSAPPWFYKLGVAVAVAASSIGPLILVGGTLAKFILPLLLLRLGPIAVAFAALVNPLGVVIRLLGQLALQAGAASVLGMLGARMVAFAGPIGIAVSLLLIFVPLLFRTAAASGAMQAATDAARDAQAKATDVATRLATATGKAKEETLKLAEAQRVQAIVAIQNAKNNMLAAKAAFAAARFALDQSARSAASGGVVTYGGGGSGVGAEVQAQRQNRDQAMADYAASQDVLRKQLDTLGTLDAAIKQAKAPTMPGRDVNFDKPKKKERDTSADDEDYAAKLRDLRADQLHAQADLTGSAKARYRAAMADLVADRADFEHQLATDKGLTDAKRATLMAEKDKELAIRKQIAEQDLSRGLIEQEADIARARNDAEQELTRARIDLADSAADRRAGELRLLELQQQQERADLDLILATKDSASAEYQNALDRQKRLPDLFAAQRAQVERRNEGPLAGYMRSLPTNGDKMNDALENAAVGGAQALDSALDGVTAKFLKLPGIVGSVANSIIASLAKIALQKAIVAPFAKALGGLLGGGGFGSGLRGLDFSGAVTSGSASIFADFGGGRAKGGGIDASKWYMVGEEGPELFAPGTSGTIIPNGGLGGGAARSRVEIVPSPWFDVRAAGAAQPGIDSMGVRAAAGGASMAKQDLARSRRRSLGGR